MVEDSPQFSTLKAHNASRELMGSTLTLVNGIGFAITIVSIQLLSSLTSWLPQKYGLFPLGPASTFHISLHES